MGKKKDIQQRRPQQSKTEQGHAPNPSTWMQRPWISIPAISILFFILSAGLLLKQAQSWLEQDKARHALSGRPLLSSHDGYYYLRLTRDLIQGDYQSRDLQADRARPFPVPLLVRMSAALTRLSGLNLEVLAFYLPPVLALGMLAVYLSWGFALGRWPSVLVAAVAGAGSLSWIGRTTVGRFDTDCLNPVLFYALAFCCFLFTFSRQPKRRLLFFLLALFLAGLFALWWQPGLYLSALFLLSYSLTFLYSTSAWERICKLGLLAGFTAGLVLILLNQQQVLPRELTKPIESALHLLHFAFSDQPQDFPSLSIAELGDISLFDFAQVTLNNTFNLLVACCGLLFLFYRNPKALIFLWPMCVLAGLAFLSNRFLIFGVPLLCLGLGYAVDTLAGGQDMRSKVLKFIRKAGAIGLALICLIPLLHSAFTFQHPVRLPRPLSALAAELPGQETAKDCTTWAWWDYGYFLQYFTGCRTLIDGGSQNPYRVYVIAFPLSTTDPILARNWIRFFAIRGSRHYRTFLKFFGSVQKTRYHLERVWSDHDFSSFRPLFPKKTRQKLRSYFFPEEDKDIFLFLPRDMLKTLTYCYRFSRLQNPNQAAFISWPKEQVHLDPKARILQTPKGQIRFSRMLHNGREVLQQQGAFQSNAFTLVLNDHDPQVFISSGDFYKTLGFRMLTDPDYSSPFFKPVQADFRNGGIWRVE